MRVVLEVEIAEKGCYSGYMAGDSRLKTTVYRITIDVGISLRMLECYYRIVGI